MVEDSVESGSSIVKTTRDKFDALRAALEAAHTYELPEVIAIPVVEGSPHYLAWIDREVESAKIT